VKRRPFAKRIPGPESLRRLELEHLPAGRGRACAPIIWLGLASHLKWGDDSSKVFIANTTIAGETGCPLRAVEYGIATLRRAGKISITYGGRGKYGWGRIIEMHLLPGEGGNPKVDLPSPADMRRLWYRARGQRERPATLVALGLAAFVLAAMANKGKVGKRRTVKPKLAQLRRLVGASHGQTFTARLDALSAAGIIERAGEFWREGIVVFGHWAIRELQKVVARVTAALPKMPMRSCASDQTPPAPWTGPPPDLAGPGDWELVLEVG